MGWIEVVWRTVVDGWFKKKGFLACRLIIWRGRMVQDHRPVKEEVVLWWRSVTGARLLLEWSSHPEHYSPARTPKVSNEN